MLKGFIAAPLTGYNEDGSVDLNTIPSYMSHLKRNRANGVFINGTTGEGYLLTLDERRKVAERWVEAKSEDVDVIVHVTCSGVEESKMLAAHADEIGASAIGTMGPCFYKPDSLEALVDYVALIAGQVPELPCYYYHMPSMNDLNFPMIEFLKIADLRIPNLAGIKYTYENIYDADLCRQFSNGKYNILHGRDEMLLSGLSMGAVGAVGSTYNYMLPIYYDLTKAFSAGDIVMARKLQRKVCDIMKCIFDTGCYFSAAKAIMRWRGIELKGVRAPLKELEIEDEIKMKEGLEELGFFEYCNEK